MFDPAFTITPAIARALMAVEADRQIVSSRTITATLLDSLRRSAKLLSTHLSTRIEGNRLTLAQVRAVVEGEGNFPGRERDEAEVRNHFAAFGFVEQRPTKPARIAESELRTTHGLVMSGRAKPTPYRDGQNVIRDGRTGRTVYLPPEAKDVPGLMRDLVKWINTALKRKELPVPVIAGLAHYQYATIHPYYDGNGRCARLLANRVMHLGGYGLGGIYSLEEYYAANLEGYYGALALGPSHNYYAGRAEADVTAFLDYFCLGLADAFGRVRQRVEREPAQAGDHGLFRRLSPQQRRALGLFRDRRSMASREVATFFSLSARTGQALCRRWVAEGFLTIDNPSTKARSYRLTPVYEALVAPD